jgi:hypothetical protein
LIEFIYREHVSPFLGIRFEQNDNVSIDDILNDGQHTRLYLNAKVATIRFKKLKVGDFVKVLPCSYHQQVHYGKVTGILTRMPTSQICIAYSIASASTTVPNYCPIAPNLKYNAISKSQGEGSFVTLADKVFYRVKIYDWDHSNFMVVDF